MILNHPLGLRRRRVLSPPTTHSRTCQDRAAGGGSRPPLQHDGKTRMLCKCTYVGDRPRADKKRREKQSVGVKQTHLLRVSLPQDHHSCLRHGFLAGRAGRHTAISIKKKSKLGRPRRHSIDGPSPCGRVIGEGWAPSVATHLEDAPQLGILQHLSQQYITPRKHKIKSNREK